MTANNDKLILHTSIFSRLRFIRVNSLTKSVSAVVLKRKRFEESSFVCYICGRACKSEIALRSLMHSYGRFSWDLEKKLLLLYIYRVQIPDEAV